MFEYKKIFSTAVLSLISLPAFSAENCEPLPDCVDIGFKYSDSDCGSLEKMKCPFDDIHYFCSRCPSGWARNVEKCGSTGSQGWTLRTTENYGDCYQCEAKNCPTSSVAIGSIPPQPTLGYNVSTGCIIGYTANLACVEYVLLTETCYNVYRNCLLSNNTPSKLNHCMAASTAGDCGLHEFCDIVFGR